MNIWLNGELGSNPPLTEEAIKAVGKFFPGCGGPSESVSCSANKISIGDFKTGSSAEETIRNLVEVLYGMGFVLEGYVNYYGDDDGRYEIPGDGTVEDLSGDECTVKDAKDSALIAELESRGYAVTKKAAQ